VAAARVSGVDFAVILRRAPFWRHARTARYGVWPLCEGACSMHMIFLMKKCAPPGARARWTSARAHGKIASRPALGIAASVGDSGLMGGGPPTGSDARSAPPAPRVSDHVMRRFKCDRARLLRHRHPCLMASALSLEGGDLSGGLRAWAGIFRASWSMPAIARLRMADYQ